MPESREESQGFFEMLWDCEYCDARGLLGKSQRHCAGCGAEQNADKRYFPKEGEQVRVDGHVYEGADRSCPACQAPQSAKANHCTHCGSPLDGAAEVRGVGEPRPGPPVAAPKPRRRRTWPIILAALVVLAGAIWWQCVRTRQAQVVVAGHRWQRVIAIEEFNEHQEEGWRNQVPVDASAVTCSDRQRSTHQIADGEDCHTERRDKKDGTFEQVKKCQPKYRSEPVMDSWCRYSARGWHPVSELKAAGTGTSPAWPAGAPDGASSAAFGARRQGKRTETLTLDFTGHGSCDVADPVWRKYADGQKLAVEVRASSGDVACGSL